MRFGLYFIKKEILFFWLKLALAKAIFHLLFFMCYPTGVVIILIPLKLLEEEQNAMINRTLTGEAISLTCENNQQAVQNGIGDGNYTHVFTSPEIALSKIFKLNVLDNPAFVNRLCLLAFDEIHLIDEWGKSFRPLYAEIEKVRKRIPCHVPLLGVSATLTKKARLSILDKAGFLSIYHLIQTSLDRPEIQQYHRYMKHSKLSCLDLQFALPKNAKEAKDIQKTIIFVNTVNEIRPIINIIRA